MNDFLIGKLRAKGWVAADADTAKLNVTEMIGSKMASGELSLVDYTAWTDEFKAQAAQKAADTKNRVAELVAAEVQKALAGNKPAAAPELDVSALVTAATQEAVKQYAASLGSRTDNAPSEPNRAEKLFAGAQNAPAGGEPRVKKAFESYQHVKSTLCWGETVPGTCKVAGQPVKRWRGEKDFETFDAPTQLDRARIAAWYAFKTHKLFGVSLPDHMMQLVNEIVHEERFVGIDSKSIAPRKLTELEIKAVLDSNTSGGDSAVPEFFDRAIITTPLLYGELLPYVSIIDVPRGSSADGFSIGTPTFVSTASGSAVTEFDTASFVTAFDTSFFPATCAISWGLDFESDTLPNFGETVMNQIGMESMRWADEQIAIGDGTTEPQGIFTASGTAVASANGTSGAFVYNDALNLAFGIGKAARNAFGGNRVRYVMKDADYKQFMQIATGVTGDTRPIFGMATQDYRLGEYPVSVQNNVTAGNIAFCNLAAYRMYRRQGLQFMTSTEGSTLMLSNRKLVVARMRWGGKLTLPTTYCAQMTDGSVA